MWRRRGKDTANKVTVVAKCEAAIFDLERVMLSLLLLL